MSAEPRFTASDPRFDQNDQDCDAPGPPKKKLTGFQTCLVGCLAMLVMVLLFATLFGIWVSRNWREWASTAASEVMKQGIDASELPPAEKAEIKAQVDRLSDEFRDGKLSAQQVGRIIERLATSPLMAIIVMPAIEKQYFDKSGLSVEEKAEGKRSLQRFWRGLIDGKIKPESVDLVMIHIADQAPDGGWRLRQRVSDDDLRAALDEAKSLADEADVPAEPEEFDPSEEFRKAIDEALKAP